MVDVYYGVGFAPCVERDMLLAFIRSHVSTIANELDEAELVHDVDAMSEEDFICKYSDYGNQNTGDTGILGLIANVMTVETDVTFSYRHGQDGQDAVILFAEACPWEMNETEKALTRDELFSILRRYMRELGLEDEPDLIHLIRWWEIDR